MIGSQLSSDGSENPINNAGARLKTQTLKSNSRSSVPYEGSDEVLNVLCTADIVTALIEAERALSIYTTYIYDNAYFAESLITALGFDYDDLDANIANYRKKWTSLATDFNATIVAPAQMTLFMRKIYLASNVFADGDSTHIKQVYAYRQIYFNKLNDVGNGTEITDFHGTHSLGELLAWIKTAIVRIRDNKDYQNMYEDLRHAFLKIFGINPMLPTTPFQFNTDPLNREQIHNIKTLPICITSNYFKMLPSDFEFRSGTDGYLYQGRAGNIRFRGFYYDVGEMSSADTVSTNCAIQYYYGGSKSTAGNIPKSANGSIYNMYKDDITGDDILDITRGNVTLKYHNNGAQEYFEVADCGTELFTEIRVYCFDDDYQLTQFQIGTVVIDNNNSYEGLTSTFFLTEDAMISRFDWHPLITFVTTSPQTADPNNALAGIREAHCIGDIYHPLFINVEDMASINEVCIFSEFYMLDSEFRTPGK
nr:putative capsid protein [Picobirnavirus sp.]